MPRYDGITADELALVVIFADYAVAEGISRVVIAGVLLPVVYPLVVIGRNRYGAGVYGKRAVIFGKYVV